MPALDEAQSFVFRDLDPSAALGCADEDVWGKVGGPYAAPGCAADDVRGKVGGMEQMKELQYLGATGRLLRF